MTDRQRLPNRRKQQTDELRHGEHTFLVSCGFDASGQVKEVFSKGFRQGSALDALIDDAMILLSIALQHDETAERLRGSLSRLGGGIGAATEPASLIGALIDHVASVEREMVGGCAGAAA